MSTPQSKCDLIEPLLGALADGEATPSEAAFAEAHLSGCASCASELAFLRATNRVLSLTPDVFPSASLSARIAQATYAKPTPMERLQAFLRPAPIRVALGSAALAGLVTVAFVTQKHGGTIGGITNDVAVNNGKRAATPSVAIGNNSAKTAKTAPTFAEPIAAPNRPATKPNVPLVASRRLPRASERVASRNQSGGFIPSSARTLSDPAFSISNSGKRVASSGGSKSVIGNNGVNNEIVRTSAASSRRTNGSFVTTATNATPPRTGLTTPARDGVSSATKPTPQRTAPLIASAPINSSAQRTASREVARRSSRKPLTQLPSKIEQPPTIALTFTPKPAAPVETVPAPTAMRPTPESVVVASAPEMEAAPTAPRRGGLQLPSLQNQGRNSATAILTGSLSRRGDIASAGGRGDAYEFNASSGGRAAVVQSQGSL